MTARQIVADLRRAAREIEGFHERYIRVGDEKDRIFEFMVLVEMVLRMVRAAGEQATVREGATKRFARKPGRRDRFNSIAVGRFEFLFGVELKGTSGEDQAPDVVVVHDALPDRPLVVVECKDYPGGRIDRGLIMAFVGVLVDLDRPFAFDSTGRQVLPGRGTRAGVHPATATDIDTLIAALGDGNSLFVTSARQVPQSARQIGLAYGFRIELRHSPSIATPRRAMQRWSSWPR